MILLTLCVMHHYESYEEVKAFLRMRGYGDEDYYSVTDMEEHDEMLPS